MLSAMTRRRMGIVVSGLALILLPQAAAAQPSAAAATIDVVAPAPDVRSGLMLGASVGRGSIDISCDICGNVGAITEALSYSLHAGVMVTPSAAVMLEHWTIRWNDRGSEWFDDSASHLVAQRITTVSGQLWFGKYVWVRGGLGVGKHISDSRYAKVEGEPDGVLRSSTGGGSSTPLTDNGGWSPAASLAVGFEFARTTTFAADVQLRVGTTRRDADEYQVHNTGLMFGASWY
jgi:hypothetical protein